LFGFKVVAYGNIIHDETKEENTISPNRNLRSNSIGNAIYTLEGCCPKEEKISIPNFLEIANKAII